MKKLLVVCLGMLLLAPPSLGSVSESESFTLAEKVGDPKVRSFFRFTTSARKYIIRHDGMGEVSFGGRRRVFYLRIGAKVRLQTVYFLEHEGDLLLLYEVSGQQFFLMRMELNQRKPRWLTPLGNISAPAQDPIIDGNVVIIGETVVSKANGHIVKQAM